MKTDDGLVIRGKDSKDIWDFENAFYWFSEPTRLNKALAHYELYKKITNLPGDIFELGVYKAASLLRFATFRNVLENDFSRKIVGFDAFGKFPVSQLKVDADVRFVHSFEATGGHGLWRNEVQELIDRKGFKNVSLVEGDIFETLPEYLDSFPASKISLLHLDMDVKEPTEYALDILYERVVPGGLIIFDDYSTVTGATVATDHFVKKFGLKLYKLSNYCVPSFVMKPF